MDPDFDRGKIDDFTSNDFAAEGAAVNRRLPGDEAPRATADDEAPAAESEVA